MVVKCLRIEGIFLFTPSVFTTHLVYRHLPSVFPNTLLNQPDCLHCIDVFAIIVLVVF